MSFINLIRNSCDTPLGLQIMMWKHIVPEPDFLYADAGFMRAYHDRILDEQHAVRIFSKAIDFYDIV